MFRHTSSNGSRRILRTLQKPGSTSRRSTRPTGLSHGNPWRTEKVYFEGAAYFRGLIQAIHRARHTIDLETYIFEKGRVADHFMSALEKASARGVRVRILVDGVGSPDFADHYGSRLDKNGIAFKIYRSWPVFFTHAFHHFHLYRLIESRRWFQILLRGGNHRDHRKLYIVDDGRVWIGSFNINDDHISRPPQKRPWRDTGIELGGVSNPVFRLAFELAWEDSWPRRLGIGYKYLLEQQLYSHLSGMPIRMTATRRLRVAYRHELLEHFRTAKKHIWILIPYFVPNRALLKALAQAARRGCDVRVVLPGLSDVPMVQWVSSAFYAPLIRAGCRLYEYQKNILHAKTLFLDSWILVGSSNLDYRSLRMDLEVNVLPQSERTKKKLEDRFRKDLSLSKEVTAQMVRQRPLSIRFLSWLFFRFRFWF